MTPRQETESYIAETEARIREQVDRIVRFEAIGKMEEARTARVLLGAMTDKRDALKLRLWVIDTAERRGITVEARPPGTPGVSRPIGR